MFNSYKPSAINDVIIDVTLAVESFNGVLIAHLLFFNKGKKEYGLDKFSICTGGDLTRNVFTITDDRGRNIAYTGTVAPRKPKPEEFIYIGSGDSLSSKVQLNKGYPVKRGRKYHVQYGLYDLDYLRVQDIGDLESNKVVVVYPYSSFDHDRLV